jgi:hypothetical protein
MMDLIQSATLILLAVGLIFNGLAVARLRRSVVSLAASHAAVIEAVGTVMATLHEGAAAAPEKPDDAAPRSVH